MLCDSLVIKRNQGFVFKKRRSVLSQYLTVVPKLLMNPFLHHRSPYGNIRFGRTGVCYTAEKTFPNIWDRCCIVMSSFHDTTTILLLMTLLKKFVRELRYNLEH